MYCLYLQKKLKVPEIPSKPSNRFMREVVKSVDCNCGKIEIFLPSLSKEEIYLMVQFLYTGKITNLSANRNVVAEVLDNLIKLLGFPNGMQSTKATPAVPIFLKETKTAQNIFQEVDSGSIKQSSKGADQNCLKVKNQFENFSMDLTKTVAISNGVVDNNVPYFSSEKTKEFAEDMEFVKTIKFDQKAEFDENTELVKIIDFDKIRDEGTMDSLEDFSSNIFRNEKGGANITEEKAIIKFVELNTENNTKEKDPIVMLEPLNILAQNSDHAESETETKSADFFDLPDKNLEKLTANPDTHKHTSACFTSKWVNQNSNVCPLLRGKKVQKIITVDKILNDRRKDFSDNSAKEITNIDEQEKMIEPEEKSEKIKENSLVKDIEANENESKNLLNQFEIHKNSTVENQNHVCEYCFKRFGKYSTLNRHLLTKRCKNYPKRCSKRLKSAQTFFQFQCSKCNLSFSKEWRLLQHQKEKHEICKERIEILNEEEGIKKMYKCKYCEKAIANKYNLKKHLQRKCTSDPNRFELIPQMRIENETTLKEDKRKKELQEETYQCKYCNMPFATNSGIKKHLRKFCTSDPNRFDLISQMKIENVTILQYQCKKCDKSFSSGGCLRQHNRIHEGKKYDCIFCGKKFYSKQNVDKHISSVHEGKKPYLCSQCGSSYGDKFNLKIHIERVHEGKKPYQCGQCDKKFGHKCHLKTHVSSFHENIRPFQCTLCSRSFFNKDQLKDHGVVHTNIRPYSCTICEDKFKRSWHLVTHLKTIHNVAKKDWKI